MVPDRQAAVALLVDKMPSFLPLTAVNQLAQTPFFEFLLG
jgi:hypothetical protein